ncbi:uncharacterized protein MAM_01237 [Metarhizium album ARSEF 1941]|uniref:Uncharacterized protein n=1 Tax=Metarhizium album (strain ARSEF 1941) TaxID=1081103 RepID=A0A0B2X2G1_METAS|nr:uncharacterized protein MAM_01237 [Metarhizium album ARSEF 1941]KHO00459.1 hypothetical protein MAM_01237 [Metarhizium album ARSEF 1941]
MAYSRRDRYDDGYYPPPPDDRFTAPPPRRHKSERHRRRSPDGIPNYAQDAYPPRRGHYRGDGPEPRGMTQPGSSARRPRSPPPYYSPEPLPREPRKDSRRDPPRHPRPERDAPRGYARDYPSPRDYAGSHDRPRRPHRDELEYRPRRDRASPPPEYRSRGREGRPHKSRPASPEPLPRARDFPPSGYGNDDSRRHRQARSDDRSRKRGVSPPVRGRDRGVGPTSNSSSSSRRKSAPAPTVEKAKKQAWWQNPLIQAGARTAFAAGAQAAMQNRNDPNPWLGSKGAKVATAALGAALMDGFGGRKKD